MDGARDGLPDDIEALKAALLIEREKALEVAAELAVARARASQDMALIAHQKLRIARLERQLYGQRSERSARLIDQREKRRGTAVRRDKSRPLVEELELYLRTQLDRLSRGHDLAKAINYILKRPAAFRLFLEDGRVCLSNNAAERGLRGVALGRRAWLFCGSDRGGQRAAMMYSLIVTAKMNDVDPQAWLADVLSRIASHPAHRLDELLPWNWESRSSLNAAQAA